MGDGSTDCYVDKLHQVFSSCDSSGCELLGKDELYELCDKLQLDEDQTYYIIDHLLIDPFTKVDFNEFKEVFVSLLTRSQVDYDEISNLSNPCSPVKHNPNKGPTTMSPLPSAKPVLTSSSSLSSSTTSTSSSTVTLNTVSSSSRSPSPSSPSPCSSTSSSTTTLTLNNHRNDNNNNSNDNNNNINKNKSRKLDNQFHDRDSYEHDNNNNSNSKISKNKNKKNNVNSHQLNDYDYDYDYDYDQHSLFSNNNSSHDECSSMINCSDASYGDEGQGQLDSQVPVAAIFNPTSAEQLLRSIWDKLRIGQDGYLNMHELYMVCEHVGMEMSDNVIEQLFEKLDCDRDGKVSFDELLQGLFEHNRSYVVEDNNNGLPNQQSQVNGLFKVNSNGPSTSSFDESRIDSTGSSSDSTMSSTTSTSSITLLTSTPTSTSNINSNINHNSNDFLNLPDTYQHHSFTSNHHHHHHPHHHNHLHQPHEPHSTSHHQQQEYFNSPMIRKISSTSSSDHSFLHVKSPSSTEPATRQLTEEDNFGSTGSYFQSLDPLILYEQIRAERDQLRINLSEANARADLLAQEVDDHHAKLEKSSKEKLILLERRYQEQIRCLQNEIQKERDALGSQNSQLHKDLSTIQMVSQNTQSKLEDMISSLKLDNLRLEKEIQDLSDRLTDAIKVNIDLQKEVEETYAIKKKLSEIELLQVFDKEAEYQSLVNDNELLRRQNKELRDENDGLILEMERMNQKSERRQKKGSKHDAASSMKRMRSNHKNWVNEI